MYRWVPFLARAYGGKSFYLMLRFGGVLALLAQYYLR